MLAKAKSLIVYLFFISGLIAVTPCFPNGTPSQKGGPTFYLGLRGGINFATPTILNRYSVFTPTSTADPGDYKKYGPWYKNIGSQYGLIVMLQLSEINYLVLQPSFSTHNFKYTGTYLWSDPQNASNSIQLVYKHTQGLKYAEFPLLFRQDLSSGNFRPYVQVGGFYSYLQGAMQNINISETMTGNQASNQIPEGNRSGSVTEQFIHTHLGLIAGGGVSYKFDFAMVGLDLQYKKGLHNITNESTRYNNQSLLGDTFDVPDDINLNAWMISLNIIFTLKNNKPARRALNCPI